MLATNRGVQSVVISLRRRTLPQQRRWRAQEAAVALWGDQVGLPQVRSSAWPLGQPFPHP